MLKKCFIGLGIILCLGLLYLLAWPIGIEPEKFEAPLSPPLTGEFQLNHALSSVKRLEITDGHGPEDIAIDAQGRLYGGLQDGRIIRFTNGVAEDWANTGGRPLGLHFDAQGNLIVADSFKGLLSVTPNAEISVLSDSAEGLPYKFTDDVDIAADGTIYFTDASWKYQQDEYRIDGIEHHPYGRFLAYNPTDGSVKVLIKDMYFANGVAVSPDQQFVLVNETWMYRVVRYWIAGEKAGTHDIFIENLPGFPDGISCNGKDTFWLAFASPRNPLLDSLSPKPFLRKVILRLPEFMQPSPVRHAFVLGLNEQGEVVHNFQEPDNPPFAVVTSVEEHQGHLYLGSLHEPAMGIFKLP